MPSTDDLIADYLRLQGHIVFLLKDHKKMKERIEKRLKKKEGKGGGMRLTNRNVIALIQQNRSIVDQSPYRGDVIAFLKDAVANRIKNLKIPPIISKQVREDMKSKQGVKTKSSLAVKKGKAGMQVKVKKTEHIENVKLKEEEGGEKGFVIDVKVADAPVQTLKVQYGDKGRPYVEKGGRRVYLIT